MEGTLFYDTIFREIRVTVRHFTSFFVKTNVYIIAIEETFFKLIQFSVKSFCEILITVKKVISRNFWKIVVLHNYTGIP